MKIAILNNKTEEFYVEFLRILTTNNLARITKDGRVIYQDRNINEKSL
jgi:hypothetical protein